MSLLCFLILSAFSLALGGCGAPPHQDASRPPAEVHGKSQAWFAENWGKPSARSKRFFGGETWTYYPMAGGNFSFFNDVPYDCQMSLAFDKEGNLEASTSSGC